MTAADRRRAILDEARRLYAHGLPDGLTWSRAMVWAHHNARCRRSAVEAQMQEIAAGVRAHEIKLGPYGRR